MSDEIRYITEPTVLVLGRQEADTEGVAAWAALHDAPMRGTDAPSAGEMLAEIAGRTCYGAASFRKPRPGGNAGYLGRIVSEGHGRVLEHAVLTIGLAGVSRSLAQELYTHMVGFSRSMASQRYIDEGDCAFVVPPAYEEEVEAALHWRRMNCDTMEEFTALDLEASRRWGRNGFEVMRAVGEDWLENADQLLARYARLTEYSMKKFAGIADGTHRRKLAREAARSVLPNCVETRIVLTGNARAFRALCETRGSAGVDAEFRRLIATLLPVLKAEWPNALADVRIEGEGDAWAVVSGRPKA